MLGMTNLETGDPRPSSRSARHRGRGDGLVLHGPRSVLPALPVPATTQLTVLTSVKKRIRKFAFGHWTRTTPLNSTVLLSPSRKKVLAFCFPWSFPETLAFWCRSLSHPALLVCVGDRHLAETDVSRSASTVSHYPKSQCLAVWGQLFCIQPAEIIFLFCSSFVQLLWQMLSAGKKPTCVSETRMVVCCGLIFIESACLGEWGTFIDRSPGSESHMCSELFCDCPSLQTRSKFYHHLVCRGE